MSEPMVTDLLKALLDHSHCELKAWGKRYSVHVGHARTPIYERREKAIREALRRIEAGAARPTEGEGKS